MSGKVHTVSLIAALLNEISQVAFAAVVAVLVHGHEDTRTANLMGAFTPQSGDLVVGVDFVELEDSELHLLPLVLDLLGLGVSLLLTLLASSFQTVSQENRGFILNATLTNDVCRLQRASTIDQAHAIFR